MLHYCRKQIHGEVGGEEREFVRFGTYVKKFEWYGRHQIKDKTCSYHAATNLHDTSYSPESRESQWEWMIELDDFRSDLAENSLLYLNAMLQCWPVDYCRYKATTMLGSASREISIWTTNRGASLKNSKLTMSFTNLQRIIVFCHENVMHVNIWGNPVGLSPHQIRDPTGRILCTPLGEDMTLVALGVVAVFEKLFPWPFFYRLLNSKRPTGVI